MSLQDVGAQDPELKNSPILSENPEAEQVLRQQIPGESVCYFNDEVFAHKTVVKSGTAILSCDRGIWIEAGPSDPDNP